MGSIMTTIRGMDFRGFDLNLLVSLRTLLEERHVTRAAERLDVSQPAMSASLARLRALLGDQLLVRGPHGLSMTPRAEALLKQLHPVMAGIEHMVAPVPGFVPVTSRRTFSVIGTDFVEYALLPALAALLSEQAPDVQLVFKGPDFRHIEARMASGELDLAIGYCPGAPDALIRKAAFTEPFVCVARRGHAAIADSPLSLETYAELQHVQVLPQDSTMYADAVDGALAALGLVRKVAVWQPSFLAVVAVVARTELIATVPARVATLMAPSLPIAAHELPIRLSPSEIALYWHPRSQDDAGHRWFRRTVGALLRREGPDDGLER